MKHPVTAALIALLASVFLSTAQTGAQTLPPEAKKRGIEFLEELEVKPQDSPPPWFDPASEPLFRFVQITDIHLTPRVEKLLLAAMRFINEKVKPAFTAITGDNSGNSSVEAQKHLKDLLDKNLKAPYYIIKGDNWARNFSKVFGSTRYAFECGSVRFVFTGLDRDAEGHGIGKFEKDTWEWMKKELSPGEPVPVILLLHENVQPPVFVEAGKLDLLLEKSPCVAATFTGHIHFDLEFKAGRVKHVIGPGFGPHRLHGFKVCEVHERHIAVRTVEWRENEYRWVPKYQKIDLPHPAKKPANPPVENYRELPPRETVFDLVMKDHNGALFLQLVGFAARIGMLEKALELMGRKKGAKDETVVVAGIPFAESPAGGFSKPSWKEVEETLPGLKEIGVDTIFLWAPYLHRVPGPGETITAHTANGDVELALKHCVHIKDYLKTDPDRGTEKEFLRMIGTAHALGLKVMAQLQVTISNPGDYIHDERPEWMLKSMYGKPAVVWPWKPFAFGFLVNKAHPGLVEFVTETVMPHWVKKWGVDGIFLDSPGIPYCDGHIMKIGERAGFAEGFECLTPVKGRFSPEILVKAMKVKLERLGNEKGKHFVFAAEDPLKTWRDLPDAFIARICRGRPDMFAFSLHPEVDRSLGKHFAWMHDYNFRSILKGIQEGKGRFSRSADYVKILRMRVAAEAESADSTKFVNMWGNAAKFFGLLKTRAAGCNLTLAATAPGGILWIGAYQLPPQCGAVGRIGGYEPDVLEGWYRKLIRIKREHPALRSKNIEDALVSPDLKGLIAYNRWCEGESITVVVNTTGEDVPAVVKTRFKGEKADVEDLLTGDRFTGGPDRLKIPVPAHTPRILALRGR